MTKSKMRIWDILFALLILLAIPAGIFHYTQGRYANAILALAAFLAGVLLLTVGRFRSSVPVPQPVRQFSSIVVTAKPASVSQEVPRQRNGRLTDWLPLSFLSGFVATGVMALMLMLGYGAAVVLGNSQGSVLARWIWALAHNPLTDTTHALLPLAIVLHFAAGIAWAIVYAALVEPRLSGPGWRRGLEFALLPWLASLVIFLPLMGGGLLGLSLGAGPLPILGNLVLHLAYGLSLGQLYPSERILAEHDEVDPGELVHNERMIALGILPGLVIGALLGLVVSGFMAPGSQPLLVAVLGAIMGSAAGALLGSFAGLNPAAPGDDHSTS
jgi:hypothetical protein